MSITGNLRRYWNQLKNWLRKVFGGKRDKTPNPITNFTVEIEQ